MLAVLRVAPLLPSPTLRAVARVMSGRDGKAGSYRSNWKAEFAGTLLERASRTHGRSSRPSVMHFYSGPPCILSPALTGLLRFLDDGRIEIDSNTVERNAPDYPYQKE